MNQFYSWWIEIFKLNLHSRILLALVGATFETQSDQIRGRWIIILTKADPCSPQFLSVSRDFMIDLHIFNHD